MLGDRSSRLGEWEPEQIIEKRYFIDKTLEELLEYAIKNRNSVDIFGKIAVSGTVIGFFLEEIVNSIQVIDKIITFIIVIMYFRWVCRK